MIGMFAVLLLELIILKSLGVFTKLDLKDIMILVLLISSNSTMLSLTVLNRSDVIQKKLSDSKRRKIILASLLAVPTVAIGFVILISRMATESFMK